MKSGVYLSSDGYDLAVYIYNQTSDRPHIFITDSGHWHISNKWAVDAMLSNWHFLGDL